ncbi:uncharacterized protein LOC110604885 [Manihot esculenta]|uniref:uncharacterized protein LOC110604885 n=1 Tax=Manihot esculenta TaxID=3983 RepID=UPI000B5D7BC1|nr:uncharacterized protein LOC110604885 [Manihot esculenta]
MNANVSPAYAKKLQARGKSPGWAAFDLKQRQEQSLQLQQVGDDPFPPLPTTSTTSIRSCGNPPSNNGFFAGSCSSKPAFAVNRLKELHSWADESLIEDVMASVNNDTDKATVFLKEMISTDNCEENGEANYFSNCEDESVLTSDLAAETADLSSTLEDSLHAATNTKLNLGHLRSSPVEPEWEQQDVYLNHRRNALRMMRLAARHSRAVTNAFQRGDHFSAQQHSSKARKEWLDAERLNAKAAKRILTITNSENNPWKLDLHGLHAAEAVKALQEHLNKIETLLPRDQPVSPGRFKTLEPFSSIDMENLDKQQTGSRHRTASLLVITGVGNHSRGEAAIPTAVRSFLSENRYHFDEARPGVISVRAKFRHPRMIS